MHDPGITTERIRPATAIYPGSRLESIGLFALPATTHENVLVIDITDWELIRACRRDDTRAWQTLIGRYERLVLSIPCATA